MCIYIEITFLSKEFSLKNRLKQGNGFFSGLYNILLKDSVEQVRKSDVR